MRRSSSRNLKVGGKFGRGSVKPIPWQPLPPGPIFDFAPKPTLDPGFDMPPWLEDLLRKHAFPQANQHPVSPRFINPPQPFTQAPVVGMQNPELFKQTLARIKSSMPQHPVQGPSPMMGPQHPVQHPNMLEGFTPPAPQPPPMAPMGQPAMGMGQGFGIGEQPDFNPQESPDFWGNWPYPRAKRPPTNLM